MIRKDLESFGQASAAFNRIVGGAIRGWIVDLAGTMAVTRFVLFAALLMSGCSGADPTADRADLIHGLFSSTAQIMVERNGKKNTGSGVVLDVDDETHRVLMVTAAHVVSPAEGGRVTVMGPRRRTRFEARVLAISDRFDLALVEAQGLPAKKADLKSSALLGDEIWVIAFPWGQRRTMVTGIVSQIDWGARGRIGGAEIPVSGPVRLVDATASFGTSGGGVFDAATGELLGIVRGYHTITFSVPGNKAAPIRFPVGGETTVVPTTDIAAFLRAQGLSRLIPEGFGDSLER